MINSKSQYRNPKLIIIILIGSLIFSSSCTKSKQVSYEYNDFIFGSYVRIKVTAQDSIQVRHAVTRAIATMRHIDSVASIFSPQSEVSQINNNGFGKMSYDLKTLITKSIEVSENSNGAFDITIGPAMKKWGFYEENQRSNIKNQKLEEIIGYQKIRIKDDSIFLKSGMAIDLGGIAVGYAVDKAGQVLKENGINTGIIDAGGEIICFGNKEYKIGIRNPKANGIIKTLSLKDIAISTSGNYENFIKKGNRKYTHIINPKTGQAIADTSGSLASVTIIANNCTDADAYATAVFVLGINDGQNLIRKLGYQGVLITEDGKMIEVNK
jgi:thiamine biosynthesis lipoprotein